MSALQAAGVAYRNRHLLARAALAALLCLLLLVALLAGLVALIAGQSGGPGTISPAGLPAGARPFLRIYADAAAVYRVNPFLLMAVHENETDFSRSTLPGVHSGVNFAGCCAGPMQFSITGTASGGSGGTWAAYRTAHTRARLPRPASYPGRASSPHPSVYDSYDAIYAAARYLHALGAGPRLDGRTYRALLSYTGTPPASIPYARHDYERASSSGSPPNDSCGPDHCRSSGAPGRSCCRTGLRPRRWPPRRRSRAWSRPPTGSPTGPTCCATTPATSATRPTTARPRPRT